MIVSARPLSRGNITRIANEVRMSVNMQDVRYFPIVDVIEHVLPILRDDFAMEIVSKEEMGSRYALTYPSRHLMRIREDVYHGAISNNGRDRFTLAHELAHYLLHKDDRIALARAVPGTPVEAYRDPEWQANAFAADILMPPNLIHGMDICDIAQEFGVSNQAASIQFSRLTR